MHVYSTDTERQNVKELNKFPQTFNYFIDTMLLLKFSDVKIN